MCITIYIYIYIPSGTSSDFDAATRTTLAREDSSVRGGLDGDATLWVAGCSSGSSHLFARSSLFGSDWCESGWQNTPI